MTRMNRAPKPTPIYRIIHIDNLPILLERDALHAPNHTPNDGLAYRTIHDEEVQASRRIARVTCGPRGTVHDYVPFYLGPRSPMLFRLHTGYRVQYSEGQEPLIYLVASAQAVAAAGLGSVFSDGHGLAAFTDWFDDLAKLDQVDWEAAYATYWNDTVDDPDRQRRKQAEFLVHRCLPWRLIERIGVLEQRAQARVNAVLSRFPARHRPLLGIERGWYY